MSVRRFDGVLGMNGRNEQIARVNSPASIRLVNDKHRTKAALGEHGIPVAETLALFATRRDVRDLDWSVFPDAWALKPNRSLGGCGILLAAGPAGDAWHTGSGRPLPVHVVENHLRMVLAGDFSPGGYDAALLEPLIRTHPALELLTFQGLPDVRIICHGDEPELAMLRLPTAASGGRANLHQGAIGAAVDLATGTITRARLGQREVHAHPDSGVPLIGAVVPHWQEVVRAASRCSAATGLQYVGADIVVDAARGPLVLEVNARPGLQIQNVTGRGLAQRTGLRERVQRTLHAVSPWGPERRGRQPDDYDGPRRRSTDRELTRTG